MSENFDLYEFPKGHSGRKRYVSVRGHRRSIPALYTYRGTDGHNYVHPDFGGDWSGIENMSHLQMPMIMRDMEEYVSPLDGKRVSSRSSHREHMLAHDVIEVGNERVGHEIKDSGPRHGLAVRDALEQAKAMPQHVYDNRIAEQRAEYAAD